MTSKLEFAICRFMGARRLPLLRRAAIALLLGLVWLETSGCYRSHPASLPDAESTSDAALAALDGGPPETVRRPIELWVAPLHGPLYGLTLSGEIAATVELPGDGQLDVFGLAVDLAGRVHLLLDDRYCRSARLATYDPTAGTWTDRAQPDLCAAFGPGAGDVAVLGEAIFVTHSGRDVEAEAGVMRFPLGGGPGTWLVRGHRSVSLTAGLDRRLWALHENDVYSLDPATGEGPRHELSFSGSSLVAIAFAPDGTLLAARPSPPSIVAIQTDGSHQRFLPSRRTDGGPVSIDVRGDGLVAVGDVWGSVSLTTTALEGFHRTFEVPLRGHLGLINVGLSPLAE